jgi:hypothetical protein
MRVHVRGSTLVHELMLAHDHALVLDHARA